MDGEYLDMRRVCYGTPNSPEGQAVFIPVCEQCGRFVKADAEIKVNEAVGLLPGSNATCSKCGRVEMVFEGFY